MSSRKKYVSDIDFSIFRRNLRKIRDLEYKKNQARMAADLGIGAQHLSDILSDRADAPNPSRTLIKLVCILFGVEEDVLLRGEIERIQPAPDPAIEDLVRRFRSLVETKDRMRTLWGLQVEACEDAERYKELEAASSADVRPTMFPTSGMLAEREWLLQRINAVPEDARFLALRKIEEALQSVKKVTEQTAPEKTPKPALEHPGKPLPADKKTRRGRH